MQRIRFTAGTSGLFAVTMVLLAMQQLWGLGGL